MLTISPILMLQCGSETFVYNIEFSLQRKLNLIIRIRVSLINGYGIDLTVDHKLKMCSKTMCTLM